MALKWGAGTCSLLAKITRNFSNNNGNNKGNGKKPIGFVWPKNIMLFVIFFAVVARLQCDTS